jgi:hypothetical protein
MIMMILSAYVLTFFRSSRRPSDAFSFNWRWNQTSAEHWQKRERTTHHPDYIEQLIFVPDILHNFLKIVDPSPKLLVDRHETPYPLFRIACSTAIQSWTTRDRETENNLLSNVKDPGVVHSEYNDILDVHKHTPVTRDAFSGGLKLFENFVFNAILPGRKITNEEMTTGKQ